jgi:hypothetical protein
VVVAGLYTIPFPCSWTGPYNGETLTVVFAAGTITPTAEQQFALDNYLVPQGKATNPEGLTGPGAGGGGTPAGIPPAGYVLTADGSGGAAWVSPSGVTVVSPDGTIGVDQAPAGTWGVVSAVTVGSSDDTATVTEVAPGDFDITEAGSGPGGGSGSGFGQVTPISADYGISSADSGNLLAFNGSSLVGTLPDSLADFGFVVILNLAASALTIETNGLDVNGSSASFEIAQGVVVTIYAGASEFYYGTGPPGPPGEPGENGGGSGIGFGSVVYHLGSYTIEDGDNGNVQVFDGANAVATLPSSLPSQPWMVPIINESSTLLTVTPAGGLHMNGSGASVTLDQNDCMFVWAAGAQWNYAVTVGSAGGGGAPSTATFITTPIPITENTYQVLATVTLTADGTVDAVAFFTQDQGDIDIAILPHGDSNPLDALCSRRCSEGGNESSAQGAIPPVPATAGAYDLVCFTNSEGFAAQPTLNDGDTGSNFANATGITANPD